MGGPSMIQTPPWYDQPLAQAIGRAMLGGAITAGGVFFGTIQAAGSTYSARNLAVAGTAAGVTFFGYLVFRGGVEGWVDQRSK